MSPLPLHPLPAAPGFRSDTAPPATASTLERCLAFSQCEVTLIGSVSPAPSITVLVLESVSRHWTDEDWNAAAEAGRRAARWAIEHPREALVKYGEIDPDAPLLTWPLVLEKLRTNIAVTVSVSPMRNIKGRRAGRLNWSEATPKVGYERLRP